MRQHFYPRSPRGERLARASCAELENGISIHAPREGSDLIQRVMLPILKVISIHAPREGSDGWSAPTQTPHPHFYPRSPRGERRWKPDI